MCCLHFSYKILRVTVSHMRVTSNGENVPQVGVNLRGSNATMETWSPPLSTS